ncbi:MAG: hypothetical protein GTO17_06805 [Candidatus Aminicenantes bacterium]|nr:hypothetical protein [Candidatus Aminicenantes bacterium]
MKCLKARRKLIAYLDNELGQQERDKIEKHLNSCAVCSKELNDLSRVFEAFCLHEEIEPSPYFRNIVKQKIEEQEKKPVSLIEIFRFAIKKPLPKIAVLLLLIGLFIVPAIISKSSAATKVLINVEGIKPNFCDPIKANLRKITGIKEVSIAPNSSTVCITLKEGKHVNLGEVERAIRNAGPYLCKDFNVVSSSRKKSKIEKEVNE